MGVIRRRLAALIVPMAVVAAAPPPAGADTAVCTWKVRVEFDRGLSMRPAAGRFHTPAPGTFGCVGNAVGHTFAPRPGTIALRGAYERSTCMGANGRGTFRIVLPRLNLSHVPTYTVITGSFSLSGPPLTGYHGGRAIPHGGDGSDLFVGAQIVGGAEPGQDCFTRPVTAATIYGTTTIVGPAKGTRAAARSRAWRIA